MVLHDTGGLLPINCPQIDSDLRKDSEIAILCDDTLAACKKMPDAFFKLIVSSPPYNIGKSYEEQVELEHYLAWQSEVIAQLVRLLDSNGSICWQVGNFVSKGEIFPLDTYFYPIFKKHGLKLRNRIIWHFGHGLHASRRFSGRYETMLWFTKGEKYTFNLDNVRVPSKYPGKRNYKGSDYGKPSGNPLGKNPSDFWQLLAEEWDAGVLDIPNVKSNHPEKTEHPCQFPVELIERCVLACTNENDYVLDPFAGAGSALIAAIKRGRRAVGIDRDQRYCDLATTRIRSYFEGTLRTRPIGKPVHTPSGREKVAQIPLEWSGNGDRA